ncbi:MAG: cytochrome b6-f complex iron-sulfur subunit [Cyclobacteriaceae bacterium]|jgi:cytochrome b6-f complex iron-sulfur subunit
MKKRDFVKKVSAAALLTSIGVSLESCSPGSIPEPDGTISTDPIVIDIAQSPFLDLQNDQGWALDAENSLLLVNLGGVITALTSVCTHAGCNTQWQYGNQIFICMCHNSRFDTRGNVTAGPATAPLLKFGVTQSGTILTIIK